MRSPIWFDGRMKVTSFSPFSSELRVNDTSEPGVNNARALRFSNRDSSGTCNNFFFFFFSKNHSQTWVLVSEINQTTTNKSEVWRWHVIQEPRHKLCCGCRLVLHQITHQTGVCDFKVLRQQNSSPSSKISGNRAWTSGNPSYRSSNLPTSNTSKHFFLFLLAVPVLFWKLSL